MQNSDSSNAHQRKLFLLQKVAKYISNNDIPINLRVCTSMPSPTYWSFKHDLILIYSLFEDGIDNFESAIERIKTPNNSNKVKIKISELMIPNRDWLAERRDLLIYEISALIIPKDFDPKSVEAPGYQQFLDRYKLQFDHLDSNEIPEVECTKILTVHQIKQLLFFIANYGFVSDSKQTLKKTFDPNDKNSVLINYKKSIKDIRKKSKMDNVSISTIEQFICSLLLKCNSYINDLNFNTDILSDIIIKIKQDGGTYEYDKKINLIPNSAIYFISQRFCFFKKLRKALTSFPKKIKMSEYLDSANLPKSKFPEWWTSTQDEVLIKFTSKYGLHHPVELFNQLTKNQPTDNFHEFLTLYETLKSKERLSFPFPISNENYAEFKFLHDIDIRIERINQIADALLAVDVQEKSTAEEKVNSNIKQQKPISLDSNDQKQVSTASINPQPISKTSDSSKTVLNADTAQKSTSNINTNTQSTSNAATVSNQASNSTANTNSVSNKASTLNSVSNVAPISKSIPISATVSKHVFKPTPDTQSISTAASTVQATPNTNLGPQKSSSLPSQKSGASTPTTATVSEITFSKSDVEEIYSKANKIYSMKPKTESDMKRRTLPDPFYQEFSRANPEKLSTVFNITNSVKKFPLGIDESLIPEEELRGLRLFPTNDNQPKARENAEITYKTVFLTEEEYNKRKQLAQQAQQDQQKLRQQQAIQQQKNIIQSSQNQTNPNIPPSMQSNQIGQQRTTNVQHTTYLSQFSNSILQQKQIMQQRQNIQQQQRISIPQVAQTQQQRPTYSQATQAQQSQIQQPHVTQQQQQRQIPQQQTIQQQQQQQRPTLPLPTQQQQQQRQVQQQQTIQQQQRPTLQQATQHQQQRQNEDTTKIINQTESQQASSRSNLLFQPKSSEPLTDKNTDKPQLLRSPPKLSNPTNQQPPRSPPPPPLPPPPQQQQQQQQQQTAAKQSSEMVPINLPDGFTIAYIPNKSCINVVITKSGKEVNNDTDFDPDDHPNSLCVSLSASISAGKTKFMITWTNFDSSGNEVSSSIKNSNLTTAYNAFKNSLNSMRESSPDLPEIKDKFPYKFFQIKPCVSGDELIEHLL